MNLKTIITLTIVFTVLIIAGCVPGKGIGAGKAIATTGGKCLDV